MVNSKEGGQNFSNRQEGDRITKLAFKLLSHGEKNALCFFFSNSIFTIVCFYVKHCENFK